MASRKAVCVAFSATGGGRKVGKGPPSAAAPPPPLDGREKRRGEGSLGRQFPHRSARLPTCPPPCSPLSLSPFRLPENISSPSPPPPPPPPPSIPEGKRGGGPKLNLSSRLNASFAGRAIAYRREHFPNVNSAEKKLSLSNRVLQPT